MFDKETETVYSENEVFDADINAKAYCEQSQELIVRNNKSQITMPLAA